MSDDPSKKADPQTAQVTVQCPKCRGKYQVSEAARGKKVTCRRCQTAFEAVPLPAPAAATSPARASASSSDQRGPASGVSAAKPSAAPGDRDCAEDRDQIAEFSRLGTRLVAEHMGWDHYYCGERRYDFSDVGSEIVDWEASQIRFVPSDPGYKTVAAMWDAWRDKIGRAPRLCGADLHGLDFTAGRLDHADLEGANLSRTTAVGLNLRGANLRGANLRDCGWYGVDLAQADLRGAELYSAGLVLSSVAGADFRGADLDHACLVLPDNGGEAQFEGADFRYSLVMAPSRKVIRAFRRQLSREQRKQVSHPACFIATACCPQPGAWQVEVLRRFRDEVLQRSPSGRSFISMYYTMAPAIADVIAPRPILRTLVRSALVTPAACTARLALAIKRQPRGP